MNSAPVTPSDFKVIIPTPTSSLCGNFVSVILKMPLLLWKLVNYLLDSNGNVSTAFRQQMVRPGTLVFSAALFSDDQDVLLCDGSEVSRAEYPDLYSAIGDVYGTASSTSNFKLPDYRGRFPVGVGAFDSGITVSLGEQVGEETTTLTLANIPSHTHDVTGLYAVGLTRASNSNGVTNNNSLADAAAFTLTSNPTGGAGTPPVSTGHNNIPPGTGVYIYVKT